MFDISIDSLRIEEFVSLIDKNIRKKQKAHILGINAEKVVELQHNEKLKKIINNSEIVHADGISIILASIFLRKRIVERIAGIDLMVKLLELSDNKGYKVYFLGAKSDVLYKMEKKLHKKYCNLQIVGSKDGYFAEDEYDEILNELNRLKPQIIFVGITSPKKEYIIDYFLKNNVETIFMGVGGSFDVLSGKIKRAPYWMQKSGLEWLFRLIQEPNRLLKRYLVGNLKFVKLLLKELYRYKK